MATQKCLAAEPLTKPKWLAPHKGEPLRDREATRPKTRLGIRKSGKNARQALRPVLGAVPVVDAG